MNNRIDWIRATVVGNTPNPGWMVLGGLVPHLAYGVALGLGMELFGELGGEERR